VKIIKEMMKALKRKIDRLNLIINANPAGELIQLRASASKALENMDFGSKELSEFLEAGAKEEKRLLALMKKQRKTGDLITEVVGLEFEWGQLNTELYCANRQLKKC
jgi:hypothetical protein